MSPSAVTNLEQAWLLLPMIIGVKYLTNPDWEYSATVFIPSCHLLTFIPPVTIYLSPISTPQAYLNDVRSILVTIQVVSLYPVSYGRVKFAEEDFPSAETNSVLDHECSPPNNRTSPDWRPQQRWFFLFSTRLTGNSSNVEIPSNFSQDLSVCDLLCVGWRSPPQRRLLQKLAYPLARLISPAGQDSFENGLIFSVEWIRPSFFLPAAMINPPVKKRSKSQHFPLQKSRV